MIIDRYLFITNLNMDICKFEESTFLKIYKFDCFDFSRSICNTYCNDVLL